MYNGMLVSFRQSRGIVLDPLLFWRPANSDFAPNSFWGCLIMFCSCGRVFGGSRYRFWVVKPQLRLADNSVEGEDRETSERLS
jgi:hypothetical protein